MGLLDMLNKGEGLFAPIAQPPAHGFDLQKMMADTEPPAPSQFAPPQERGQGRGGVFGSGYSGEDIMSMLLRAAAIAQGDYGGAAQLGSNIGAKARAEAEAAYKRQAELADYEAKRQIDQRYEKGPAPARDETYEVIKAELGPDAARAYLRSKGDPTITTTLPGDRFYSGPRSDLAAALGGVTGGTPPKSAPPAEAIAELKSNPSTASQFDEVFGHGASARYLGGGASNSTGGFPR